MSNELLMGKTAIIYGAGGSIGGAVARTFAREGATVHLAGRTLAPLQAVADDIAAVDMSVAQFMTAFDNGVKSAFLTARAAARQMVPRGTGVILHLTSGSSRGAAPMMGNTGPLDGATDALLRYLAAELGPHGIRAVGIHTAAVAETLTREKLAEVNPGMDVDPQQILAMIAQRTMLGRAPAVQQVADTAAFLAADRAGAITSQMVNATCGLVAG